MKVRITYGIDKLLEGATYHEQHILDDLKALAQPATDLPAKIIPLSQDIKGVDTEYAKDGELLTVAVAHSDDSYAFDFKSGGFKWDSLPCVASLSGASWLVGHNIPGDIDQLLRNGLPIKEEWLAGYQILDSLVLTKMQDENKPRGSYSLEPLMLTNFNVPPWKTETDKKFKETGDARDWTPEEREERCRLDAWASFMLAKKLYPEIAHDEQTKLLVETIHRISMTLYRIGLAGAKVDSEYLAQFTAATATAAAVLESELQTTSRALGWDGEQPFCPTKDDDIRHLLYDIMTLPVTSYTDSKKPAVDKVALSQHGLPITQDLLAFNKVQKLDSVYRNIDEYIDEQGFIHFWINQLGARTGRRSSGGGIEGTPDSKNAQNWPPKAKQMIISRFPGGKIGAFDYKSLEPILAAYIAQDGKLFDFFYDGNGYVDVGKEIGVHVDKNDPSTPYRAIKSMTLGLFYNMQQNLMAKNLWLGVGMGEPFKFSEDYKTHVKITGEYRTQIVHAFRGLQLYWEKQKLLLERDGQIVAPDGYIRHLPHHGKSTPGYWKLINQAINFPVQHLASMVTGCAMIDCEQALLDKHGWDYASWQNQLREGSSNHRMATLINEVHDELTWDFHAWYESDMGIILEIMSLPPTLSKLIPDFDIKLKIEPSIADRWGDK